MASEQQSAAQEKPAYSVKYSRDSEVIGDVSVATTLPWLSGVGIACGVLGLVMVIFFLNSGGTPNWIGTIAGLIISLGGTATVNNSAIIQSKRMERAGMTIPEGATKEDLHCEVDFFEDHLDVKGPFGVDATHPYSAITKFIADENVIVLRFGKEYVVAPRSAMSDSRYFNLIDFIDARTDK